MMRVLGRVIMVATGYGIVMVMGGVSGGNINGSVNVVSVMVHGSCVSGSGDGVSDSDGDVNGGGYGDGGKGVNSTNGYDDGGGSVHGSGYGGGDGDCGVNDNGYGLDGGGVNRNGYGDGGNGGEYGDGGGVCGMTVKAEKVGDTNGRINNLLYDMQAPQLASEIHRELHSIKTLPPSPQLSPTTCLDKHVYPLPLPSSTPPLNLPPSSLPL